MSLTEEILDTHLAIIERLQNSPELRTLVNASAREAGLPTVDRGDYDMSSATSMGVLLQEADTFRICDTVSEAMIDVAGTHPADMTCDAFEPPKLMGCAVLDKAFEFPDINGIIMAAHVITWVPLAIVSTENEEDVRFGYMVLLWNDTHREADYFSQKIIRDAKERGTYQELLSTGMILPVQFVYFYPGAPAGPLWIDTPGRKQPSLSVGRCLMGLWDLMARVPESSTEGEESGEVHVRRTVRKRAARTIRQPRVREVALHSPRRPVQEKPEGAEGEGRTRAPVDHRVVVRTHKRMQAYGPGRRLRREITVESYEYGPENPPDYVPPKRVYRVQ